MSGDDVFVAGDRVYYLLPARQMWRGEKITAPRYLAATVTAVNKHRVAIRLTMDGEQGKVRYVAPTSIIHERDR